MNNPPPISVLGKEKALALCAEFGGSSIYIPKQETLNRELRNKEIIEEYKNGVSLHQLPKKYQLSETTLRTIILNKFISSPCNKSRVIF